MKQSITYYKDLMRGVSHVEVHKSGAAALKHFKSHANIFFEMPIKWDSQPTLKNGHFAVHIGFRGYHVRYLNEEEVALYDRYKDDVWITSEGYLTEPKKEGAQ